MSEADLLAEALGTDAVLATPEYLQHMHVPVGEREYFQTWGLPRRIVCPYGLTFTAYEPNGDPATALFRSHRSGLLLGEMDGPVYVTLKDNGSVALYDESVTSEVYINSTVRKFVKSLGAFRLLVRNGGPCKSLRKEISEIDESAMSNDEYYWPVAIEDMTALEL